LVNLRLPRAENQPQNRKAFPAAVAAAVAISKTLPKSANKKFYSQKQGGKAPLALRASPPTNQKIKVVPVLSRKRS